MVRRAFIRTAEHKRNIGLANKGKRRTLEQRKRISEGKKGRGLGSENPHWKGNDVSRLSARSRAHKMYPLQPCEICGDTKNLQRHHKDNNTANNLSDNIQFLCAKCHLVIDGRQTKNVERMRRNGHIYQAQSVISRWYK